MRLIFLLGIFMISLQLAGFVYGRSQFTLPEETPAVDSTSTFEGGIILQQTESTGQQESLQHLSLALTTSKSTYHLGENISISVMANRDCYLTLLDFSTTGNVNVLFPNEYQQNNLIRENKKLMIPNTFFEIKIGGEIGKEQLWARCSLDSTPLFNIEYDFQKSTFTHLGDMKSFKEKHRIPPVFNAEKEAWVEAQINIKK